MTENYISKISDCSDRYGNPYLTGLMGYYGVCCLADVTEDMAKAYYKKFVEGEEKVTNL